MMKKKQSIIALVLAAIVTVLLGWTMIKGWGPTGTGSMKNINLGLDLSGGVSITYQAVKDNPTDEEMSDTRYKLEQRAQQYSEEAQVYLQGDNRITIEIPGATDATTILEEMGKPGSLYFIKQTNDDGTEKPPNSFIVDTSSDAYLYSLKGSPSNHLGLSPRSASTFSIPASLISESDFIIESFDAPTHVRCAIVATPYFS